MEKLKNKLKNIKPYWDALNDIGGKYLFLVAGLTALYLAHVYTDEVIHVRDFLKVGGAVFVVVGIIPMALHYAASKWPKKNK